MPRLILFLAALLLAAFPVWSQTGTIKGHVVDNNGEPVLGASIRLLHAQRAASADINGEYQILDVPSGLDTLQMIGIGYGAEYFFLQIIADSTTVVDGKLFPESIWMEPDIYVPYADNTSPGRSTLIGSVRDEATGEPLPDISFGLEAEGFDTLGHGWREPSGSMREIERGRYVVYNVPHGYFTAYVRAAGYPYVIRKITVRDDSMRLDFQLSKPQPEDSAGRPVRVIGRVWDSIKHRPFQKALVTVLETGQTVLADAEGVVILQAVLPGTHYLRISAPGYHTMMRRINVIGGKDNDLDNYILMPEDNGR
jgi:hypothetical protein